MRLRVLWALFALWVRELWRSCFETPSGGQHRGYRPNKFQ